MSGFQSSWGNTQQNQQQQQQQPNTFGQASGFGTSGESSRDKPSNMTSTLHVAFGGSSAFGQNPQQQQPAANPMFGNLGGTPNTNTSTTGFGALAFHSFGHDLMASKAHLVTPPTHLKAHLLSALPNLPRALAHSEVEPLLGGALLDKIIHPQVGQGQPQGYSDNPQPRVQLEPSALGCLVPINQQLRDLGLQLVFLFILDVLSPSLIP